MTDLNAFNSRCILALGLSVGDASMLSLSPLALCVGNPPEDPLQLYPLCLDCDMFHQRADRYLFSRLAILVGDAIAVIANRQQDIIDFLPDATFVIDRDHKVIAWNKAIVELSGVPADNILGKGNEAYSKAFYGGTRPLLIDFIGQDLESARGYYHKVEVKGLTLMAEGVVPPTGHNAERYLLITASPLLNRQGGVIGAIESIRDITETKNAEYEREQLKNQLHQAQRLDSIGQLAGGIAHEFNNIMAAILGYAGILEMGLGNGSPALAAVQSIISATEKAAMLTQGMLTFSRMQAVAPERIRLDVFVADMKDMLCRMAGENICMEFLTASEEPEISADPAQMQQLILNLCNNAIGAMPDGGRLVLSTDLVNVNGSEADLPMGIRPGSYVRLTVADTGFGISPENMERIFDPFFTTKDVGKGTGLGLSIVFGIVRQHDGFIGVSSIQGDGTRFTVWFPQLCPEESTLCDNGLCSERQMPLGGTTILVGEDNEDVRPMIIELLQNDGYQVYEARDGLEVVSIMNDFGDTVDLLLLDVIMPRMNGYEALSAVRILYPDVPCLFLSGYSDETLKQKVQVHEDFEYMSKPIMPESLMVAVRRALGSR